MRMSLRCAVQVRISGLSEPQAGSVIAALEPDNYLHPLALAQILQQVGQSDNALNFANQALALAPDEQKSAISDLIASLSGSG